MIFFYARYFFMQDVFFIIIINVSVRISLRAPSLISQILKLTII